MGATNYEVVEEGRVYCVPSTDYGYKVELTPWPSSTDWCDVAISSSTTVLDHSSLKQRFAAFQGLEIVSEDGVHQKDVFKLQCSRGHLTFREALQVLASWLDRPYYNSIDRFSGNGRQVVSNAWNCPAPF